jgi:hypothetical protein
LQLGREFILRPSFSLAQFSNLRADYIQLRRLFFDARTLAAPNEQSCRLYLTLCDGILLDRQSRNVKLIQNKVNPK